jgi:hypothetical protein
MLTIDSTLQKLPSLFKGEHVEILDLLLDIFSSMRGCLIYQINQKYQMELILTEWNDLVKVKLSASAYRRQAQGGASRQGNSILHCAPLPAYKAGRGTFRPNRVFLKGSSMGWFDKGVRVQRLHGEADP